MIFLYICHYSDTIKIRDLILSLFYDNNIKYWNFINFECLVDIKNINENGFMNSSCLLIENNKYYFFLVIPILLNCEQIKIYNLKGNKIKEINDSNNSTNFIDIFYDNNINKNFVIIGNDDFCRI